MAGRSLFGRGSDEHDDDPDGPPPGAPSGPNEGVRIIDPDEAERVAGREDVAPRRGGDTPRYGDRPKPPPPGPKPALRFPLDEADDPSRLDRPRAAPVPPAGTAPVPTGGEPAWSVATGDEVVEQPTESIPIVTAEEIGGYEAFLPGEDEQDDAGVGYDAGLPEEDGVDEDETYEDEAYEDETYEDGAHEDGYDEDEFEAELDEDEAHDDEDVVAEGVISLDPPSDEVVLPHWTEPATGEVPRVLVDDDADDERWASFAQGPRWRDQHEGWEGETDLTGDLADDLVDQESSLGALDTTERPTHEEFLTFEDLEVPEADEHTVANLGVHGGDAADVDDDLGELGAPAFDPPASSGTLDDPIRIGSAPEPARPVAPGARPRRPEGDRPGRPARPEGGRPRGPRPGGPGEPGTRARRAPAGRAPGEVADEAPRGGRDVGQATVVGLGIAAVGILAFMIHPVAALVLVEIVVVLAGIEYFAALRRGGDNPPTLLGLAAITALPLAAYARGEAAMPLVLFLFMAFGVLWYLFSVGGGRPVRSLGITLLGVVHVGMLGAFAALLLAIGPVGGAVDTDQGVSFLLLAVMAAVGYDVGGFFVGRRLGRTPLTQISPGKTVEGLVAGMGAAFLALLLTHLVLGIGELSFAETVVLGLACALAAPVGDLAESLVKRDLGIKDMGGLLPGHGGAFDRFDALLFVLPTAYYVIRIFFLG